MLSYYRAFSGKLFLTRRWYPIQLSVSDKNNTQQHEERTVNLSSQTIEIALGRTTQQHGGWTFTREVSDFVIDCKFGRTHSVSSRDYVSEWKGSDGETYRDQCTFYTLELKTGDSAIASRTMPLTRIGELVDSVRILLSQDAVAYRVAMGGTRKGFVVGSNADGSKIEFDGDYFGV